MSCPVQIRPTFQGLPRPWKISLAATALPLVGVATALVLWSLWDAMFERRLERRRARKRKSCRKAVDGVRRRISNNEVIGNTRKLNMLARVGRLRLLHLAWKES